MAYWANNFLGLKDRERLGKTKLVKIMRWVEDQYEVHGRTTAVSDREMEELVKEHLPERYEACLANRQAGRDGKTV